MTIGRRVVVGAMVGGALFGGALPLSAQASGCTPAFSQALIVLHDRPYFRATINAHEAWAFIDTGAVLNALRSRDELKALGMKRVGTSQRVITAAGTIARTPLDQGDVTIGGTDLHASRFLEDFSSPLDQGTVLLGLDLIRNYTVAIDHKAATFAGFSPRGCKPDDIAGSLATRFRQPSWHRARTVTATVNGKPLTGLLDTGAQITVLSRRSAHRVGITDAMLAEAGHSKGTVLGGTVVDDTILYLPITLAGRTFDRAAVAIHDMPQDMLVGESLLKDFSIVLPARSNDVYLTPMPASSPAPMPRAAPVPSPAPAPSPAPVPAPKTAPLPGPVPADGAVPFATPVSFGD